MKRRRFALVRPYRGAGPALNDLLGGHIDAMVDAMPVAYAVTYLYGTAGSAWFLASVGPKLLSSK